MPRERIGKYVFEFCSYDCQEGMHIHIKRDWKRAKVWLTSPAIFSDVGRFSRHEQDEILKLANLNADRLYKMWNTQCKKVK